MIVPTLVFGGHISAVSARTPDDTFYGRQWYLPQIGAEAAWDKTTGSRKVIVAVVDTGMDIDHEDLRQNIWTNQGETFGNGIDDDKNGFVDDIHGWNFENGTNEVRPKSPVNGHETDQGYVHATLVASLIGAAGNNGIGVAGLAWNVQLMPVPALDDEGGGSTHDVARAIRYAVDNGAHIINLSIEGYGDAQEVDDAVEYARTKGVLTVAAAGNSDDWEGSDLDEVPVYPACLSSDLDYGLLGVGSTDEQDQRAPFANYGSCIQVSAPGNDIFGARPSASSSMPGYAGGYSGTSLAAPLVAGTAALIKSLRPDWGWAEIRERIMSSAVPIDHLQSPTVRGRVGRGRLDVAAAIAGTPILNTPQMPSQLFATTPGKSTRVRIMTGAVEIEIMPFGSIDTRGARAAFTDVDNDGTFEVIVVPASGKRADWALFEADGKERTRGTLAMDLRDGVLVVAANGGFIVADPNGGRAWGVDVAQTSTLFYPFGPAYRAGLDLVSVPGGAAFAPRGGGGHLMVMDRAGRRLVSVFPFGKDLRGRWSVARVVGVHGTPSLVMSGPSGSRSLDIQQLGATGWQDVSLVALEQLSPLGSLGRSSGVAGELTYDVWKL